MVDSTSLQDQAPPVSDAANKAAANHNVSIKRSIGSRLGRPLVGIILLAVIGLGGAIPFMYLRAENALKAAHKAQQTRSFDEARRQLDIYLELHPNNPEPHFLLARIARQVGQYEEAKRRLDICQRLEGPTTRITLERRLIPVQQGAFPVLLESWLQQLLDKNHPDSEYILEALSRGCMASYRLYNAKTYLGVWLERDPDNVQAYLWRAGIHQHLMDFEHAKLDCQRAVALAPGDLEPQGRLAQILLIKGEIAEAAEIFNRLYGLTPENPTIALGMIQCKIKLGELEEVKTLLDDMATLHPNNAAVMLERGRVALLNDDPRDARPWLEKASALAPIDQQTLLTLVQCLKRLGEDDLVAQWQKRLDKVNADGARLRELTEKLQKQPYDLPARCEIGRLLLDRHEDRLAIEWLKETLGIDPGNDEANTQLADYYEKQGNPALAARYRAKNGPEAQR
ncbi:MAG: tetratricopeptide repeat protein [Gemmataceae bacterium]